MAIRYKCPRCDSFIEAPDEAAGKSHTCPSCLEVHRVPQPEKKSPPPRPAEAQSSRQGQTQGVVTGESSAAQEGESGQARVSVKCEKCGHYEENVVFYPGMKCTACKEGAMAPVVDTAPEELSWKERLVGVSIFKMSRRAKIAAGVGIVALSVLLGWLLSSLGGGEGAMSDVAMACPQCSKYYYVNPSESSPKCRKCKVALEKGYVCADCKTVFAASKTERGQGGQPVCPHCKSTNVKPLGRKVVKSLGLK